MQTCPLRTRRRRVIPVEYGRGPQHLGIGCRSRDEAVRHIESLGGILDDQGEYTGVRFAFVDVPTGPATFELLESTSPTGGTSTGESSSAPAEDVLDRSLVGVALDRATIVTPDVDEALRFYSDAFRWRDGKVDTQILRYGGFETPVRRVIGCAGTLELELIQPECPVAAGSEALDPYSKHLARGTHGLVHAGGSSTGPLPSGASASGEWAETGEHFSLYDWAGGRGALQVRTSTSSRDDPGRSE